MTMDQEQSEQVELKEYTLTLLPEKKQINILEGESVLHAAKRQGVLIKSSCGGVANCRTCVVKVIEGEKNMCDVEFEEGQLIGNVFHITRERLSCQLKCTGDMTIDIVDHLGATLKDVGSKTLK